MLRDYYVTLAIREHSRTLTLDATDGDDCYTYLTKATSNIEL